MSERKLLGTTAKRVVLALIGVVVLTAAYLALFHSDRALKRSSGPHPVIIDGEWRPPVPPYPRPLNGDQ
ncbi:MAG: hypothetical protein IPG50_16975 [Myxococcales bacterium]|nr:hypothetical protein [Myxococcales bacterium]